VRGEDEALGAPLIGRSVEGKADKAMGRQTPAAAINGGGARVGSGIGMAIRVWVSGTRRGPDPTGTGMGTIFHPWVAPIPDPA
jgi:hypothetical protein